jgi:hypothetical protein
MFELAKDLIKIEINYPFVNSLVKILIVAVMNYKHQTSSYN